MPSSKSRNSFTLAQIRHLKNVGDKIRISLSCDANNGIGPCGTDRLEAVRLMATYLRMHGYSVARRA